MARSIIFFVILVSGTVFSSCKKEGCVPKQKKNCVCTMIYDPVCGCDGQTYGNPCTAECNSIYDYTEGDCKP